MSEIVHLEDAKEYLRVRHTQHDSLIQKHIDRAEQTLLRYLLGTAEQDLSMDAYYYEFGDGATNSSAVELAVLIMTGILYEYPNTEPLSDAVRRVLYPLRGPQAG